MEILIGLLVWCVAFYLCSFCKEAIKDFKSPTVYVKEIKRVQGDSDTTDTSHL